VVPLYSQIFGLVAAAAMMTPTSVAVMSAAATSKIIRVR
jgi:hypothetical protein